MAVRHCWESTYTARAIEYRRGHGIGLESIRLAALVQRLIVADASAVAFSANPVTGSRKEVVIETAWGLGESIVGGTVTPDSYVLRKEDSAVVSRRIADKHLMTVPLQGGTSEIQTPSFLRDRPALDDEQAVEIAHLAYGSGTTNERSGGRRVRLRERAAVPAAVPSRYSTR